VTPVSASEIVARAAKVKVVGFDVDGVCTDGRLYYGPTGEQLHAFHTRDGLGMALAREAGIVLCAITGRDSFSVGARMRELRVPHVLQGVKRKREALDGVLATIGATLEECAFIGDDVNDIPCLSAVGLAACVPEAADEVHGHVHFVTKRRGGEGALRELLECVLKAQSKWSWEERR
jgi:3-deoxy-D-manno-octulosonate 8-phosphate phosphatase (KDO 8-P phosphatase)